MADKYKVLKRIDWKGKAYLPLNYFGYDEEGNPLPSPRPVIESGATGEPIPIDISGVIELPIEEAEQLVLGQIAPLDTGKPNVSGYKKIEEGVTKAQSKKGIEDKLGDDEKGAWTEGAPRSMNPNPNEGTLKVGKG